MSKEDSCVNVALRVRPLVPSEIVRGCQIAIERVNNGKQVMLNRTDAFTYSYVFDRTDSQRDLYETAVMSRIKKLLDGFNVTILAYGQTGSGKTYTMGTAFNGILDEDSGVIPRAIKDLFDQMASLKDEVKFSVKCSFIELYQEQIYDLLSPNGRQNRTLDLREGKDGIKMPGLTEVMVTTVQEVTDQLVQGSTGRAVASTAMNEQSSRSHAVFTVSIACNKLKDNSVVTARLNLVDLAGSERCTKTQATGDRFKEGVNINLGLLALGNVINALGAGQNSGFVPYRQSKLTRLLQDSLGGNSITLMIACISPADYNVQETLSTLRYADRALQIKNKPIVNEDPNAAEINRLKGIIQQLRVELLTCSGGGITSVIMTDSNNVMCSDFNSPSLPPPPPPSSSSSAGGAAGAAASSNESHLEEQLREAIKKNRRLQEELQQALNDVTEHEMRAHIAESAQEKLRARITKLKEMLAANLPKSDDDNNDDHQWVNEVTQFVNLIDDEQKQTETELRTHREERQISATNLTKHEQGDFHELMQPQTEEYTNKQIDLNYKLRDLNYQLELKQGLHLRVKDNFEKLFSHTNNELHGSSANEQRIAQLEEERVELLSQLQNVKLNDKSARISEERRKRLMALETEIADLRRTILRQTKSIKLREKEAEKIKQLAAEITAIKESKVKLIRAMRVESENFRQWKMLREKELMQLKNKDRKMQNDMVRKEELHTKQRLVLKRKCEEALAINKRLKEALDRQTAAQRQRQATTSDNKQAGKQNMESWVHRELAIILSTIDAEQYLSELMEDRAMVNGRINELKQQDANATASASAVASAVAVAMADADEEINNLEKELELRNAQIFDLQQKVCLTDMENRIQNIGTAAHNMDEARKINGHLLQSIVNQRRELMHRLSELKQLQEIQREQLTEVMEAKIEEVRIQHAKLINEQQNDHEKKLAMLLQSLRDNDNGNGNGNDNDNKDNSKKNKQQEQEIQNFTRTLSDGSQEFEDAIDSPMTKDIDSSIIVFKDTDDDDDGDDDDIEMEQNENRKPSVGVNNLNVDLPSAAKLTPSNLSKMARLSNLNFNTPSTKRKFL